MHTLKGRRPLKTEHATQNCNRWPVMEEQNPIIIILSADPENELQQGMYVTV